MLAFGLELNANTSMATWDGNVFSTAAIWQWGHDSVTWLWGRCLQQIIKLRYDCEMSAPDLLRIHGVVVEICLSKLPTWTKS